MTDDLIARLRATATWTNGPVFTEAADRIAALEKENFALAAWQCLFHDGKAGLVCDDHGGQYCAKERRIAALEVEQAAAKAALRNIAEGNLGPASWQADYDKIRAVATTALAPPAGPAPDPVAEALRVPEIAALLDAANQSRLAFGGFVSGRSAVDKLDAALAALPKGAAHE